VVWQLLAGAAGACPTPGATGRAGMHRVVKHILSGVRCAGEDGVETK